MVIHVSQTTKDEGGEYADDEYVVDAGITSGGTGSDGSGGGGGNNPPAENRYWIPRPDMPEGGFWRTFTDTPQGRTYFDTSPSGRLLTSPEYTGGALSGQKVDGDIAGITARSQQANIEATARRAQSINAYEQRRLEQHNVYAAPFLSEAEKKAGVTEEGKVLATAKMADTAYLSIALGLPEKTIEEAGLTSKLGKFSYEQRATSTSLTGGSLYVPDIGGVTYTKPPEIPSGMVGVAMPSDYRRDNSPRIAETPAATPQAGFNIPQQVFGSVTQPPVKYASPFGKEGASTLSAGGLPTVYRISEPQQRTGYVPNSPFNPITGGLPMSQLQKLDQQTSGMETFITSNVNKFYAENPQATRMTENAVRASSPLGFLVSNVVASNAPFIISEVGKQGVGLFRLTQLPYQAPSTYSYTALGGRDKGVLSQIKSRDIQEGQAIGIELGTAAATFAAFEVGGSFLGRTFFGAKAPIGGIAPKTFSANDWVPGMPVGKTEYVPRGLAQGSAEPNVFQQVYVQKGDVVSSVGKTQFNSQPQVTVSRVVGVKPIENLPAAVATERGLFTNIMSGAEVKRSVKVTTYAKEGFPYGAETTGYTLKDTVYVGKPIIQAGSGEVATGVSPVLRIPKRGPVELGSYVWQGATVEAKSIPIRGFGVGTVTSTPTLKTAQFGTESVLGTRVSERITLIDVTTSNKPLSNVGSKSFGIYYAEGKPTALTSTFYRGDTTGQIPMFGEKPKPTALYKPSAPMKPMGGSVGTTQVQQTITKQTSEALTSSPSFAPTQATVMKTSVSVAPAFSVQAYDKPVSVTVSKAAPQATFNILRIADRVVGGLTSFSVGSQSYKTTISTPSEKLFNPQKITSVETKTFPRINLVQEPTTRTYQPEPQLPVIRITERQFTPQVPQVGQPEVPYNPNPTIKVPPPEVPFTGIGFPLGAGDLGGQWSSQKGKRPKTRYQPSFIATQFNIRGKAGNSEALGFALRPIVGGKGNKKR